MRCQPLWLGLIAIAACLGHIWPVFFGFKGGKALLPLWCHRTHWLGSHRVMAGTRLLTVLLSGYSSLGRLSVH
ncbi:hypothetical protein DMI69_06615 [Escherichia coli]|nr:hypothetical protein [Escherichia coli]